MTAVVDPGADRRELINAARGLSPAALSPGLASRLKGPLIVAIVLGLAAWSVIDLKIFGDGLGAGFNRLGGFAANMFPPSDGGDALRLFESLAVTMAMAFAATVVAAILAAPLGFISSRTVTTYPPLHFAIRRVMDLLRGVPVLVWALILVVAFGLGPFAGVTAMVLADLPRLGKLFGEALENVDPRPGEALRASGAGWLEQMRFAVFPQVGPAWLGLCLFFLEGNFRTSAVLGLVGAGGIGFELHEAVRVYAFDVVLYVVLMYIVTVGVLDWVSGRLRAALS